ncbi:hypothetical protein ABVT39_004068 [Epinephelus coioides]
MPAYVWDELQHQTVTATTSAASVEISTRDSASSQRSAAVEGETLTEFTNSCTALIYQHEKNTPIFV